MDYPTDMDDVIDSRDVIAAIEELTRMRDEGDEDFDDYDATTLAGLEAFAAEASDYCADWEFGEVLVRDSYFTDYAQQLAEDLGLIDDNARWPATCIDWEQAAQELRTDYTSAEFNGTTYWFR